MIKIYYSEKVNKLVMYDEAREFFISDEVEGQILDVLFDLVITAANLQYVGEL